MNTYCEWEWMSESLGVMQTGCNMRNIRSAGKNIIKNTNVNITTTKNA